ncbi:MAG: nuclease-related domain-containing protein [Gallionella sp.]
MRAAYPPYETSSCSEQIIDNERVIKMILKEKKFKSQSDPKLESGDKAEKQMAFYLQRAFGKTKDIFVLNDLRIVHEGDTAQIDHLLVTRYGLFIVESKSVYGTVAFNEYGEWMRIFGNGEKIGMPSPIKQAEEQGKIIKAYLRENTEKLLGKALFGKVQKGFRFCPISVRVAISDDGVIERGLEESRVQKAQVIAESISKELKKLKSAASLFSLSTDIPWEMELEEFSKVANALFIAHRPLAQGNQPENTEVDASKSIPVAIVPNDASPSVVLPSLKVGDSCPRCKKGQLVHKDGVPGKSDFLACTN